VTTRADSPTPGRGHDGPPALSIAIPVLNGERLLPGLIESILAQEFGDWEVIVGDNVSDDGTPELIAAIGDDRFRTHLWTERVPVMENFNRTIALARSEWVIPIGADDRLRPGALATIAARIAEGGDEHPLAMVVGASRRVDWHGRSAERAYYGSQQRREVASGTYHASEWLRVAAAPGAAPWNIGSIAFNRSAIDAAGGPFRPEIGLSSDTELVARIAIAGDVAYVDEELLDCMVRLESDGNVRFVDNLRHADRETPVGIALLAALDAHEGARAVDADERAAVRAAVARTHLQRAGQHRLLPGGQGRRSSARDILRAFELSPRTVLSPRGLTFAMGAILAPRSAIAVASRQLTNRAHGSASTHAA
jgi:glycosyltransferase involved in cell wall biosynthesis